MAFSRDQRLAFWTLVAERIERSDPQALVRAQERLTRWQAGNSPAASGYWREWEAWIQRGVPAVVSMLREDSEHADALRSTAPFVDVISQEERRIFLESLRTERAA
ncbi:hypothetical protein [Pseudoxanthomonas kaohsiungensis]|uniref:Uncharacterized protein n=1 Tax=Pseudoxanthomonas kaohsiungensis TaxID=283923 RepID=A0ABW3M1C7_9GAMM|nr:hypothetical protein [Pseudoxanthomonas kaohsiungensis]KAF1702919.1 hypothetical protein CSC66_09090 [Pseudoxanthomonas kaohsiungensis]